MQTSHEESSFPIPEKIGSYCIERKLGQGGMGEVFLAFDPICKRRIALKQIRKELCRNDSLQKRFLREALVAAHLSHPSIIPIYSIHKEENAIFYTMPFVEGETLKQIIKTAQEQEQEGEIRHPIGSSIPILTTIFLKVCQAIAYAHAKGILHRDIKPDNIIVGKYGEVLLFDWGLADVIAEEDPLLHEEMISAELTRPGKIPGTLLYLAPERIRGQPSSPQTDIYALGVILYQILTLHPPFHRKSLDLLRKTLHLERIINPLESAPYRDIPQLLADVVMRCLRQDSKERFQRVDEIISEINSYIEGRPEWIPTTQLSIEKKEDWEFQENVLLAKHMAITRSPDVLEWVSLMISRPSFTGNTRVETRVKIHSAGNGIGILLAIPDASERKGLVEEGYYLWIGSENHKGLCIFQFNVEVMRVADVYLKLGSWHTLAIELIDNHLNIYLDETLRCHYISHVPMAGTHVGVLYKDADFTLEALKISLGSQNAMVNCLAIPDIFLANKNYTKALVEYRRIASSFAGRTEGREALFRAGITLLQQAIHHKSSKEKDKLYNAAQEQFSALRFTPGAPLEFLGKSLIYKALNDIEEEEKCLELCLRKYNKHPLIKVIVEHIIFRLHDSANQNRIAAYHFLLLALGHLPKIFTIEDNAHLFESLRAHLEPLAFLIPLPPDAPVSQERLHVAVQIAFWLAKPMTLIEMVQGPLPAFVVNNAFLCLLCFGANEWIQKHLKHAEEAEILKIAAEAKEKDIVCVLKKILSSPLTCFSQHLAYFLMEREIMKGKSEDLLAIIEPFSAQVTEDRLPCDILFIWICLLQKKWQKARQLLESYPQAVLADEYSPLYPLMGCYLRHAEGKQIALTHLSLSIDLPYPPTSMLLSFYLQGKITEKKGWISTAFKWEKLQLLRQLHLYYHCAAEQQKASYYLNQMKRELKRLPTLYAYP